MPRILVTGCNGFMGSHMLELLVRRCLMGDRVDIVATDIAAEPASFTARMERAAAYDARHGRPVTFQYAPCDITWFAGVDRFITTYGPFDVVFHIAGLFSYSAPLAALEAVNIDGTVNVVSALERQRPSRRVHVVLWGAGGIYDFSNVPERGVDENHPIAPSAAYLETKYRGEQAALHIAEAANFPLTVLRPGGVYGPRSQYGVVLAIKAAARGGLGPQYIGPRNTRAGMIHAEDVCRAAAFVVAHSSLTRSCVFNVNDDGCVAEGRAYTTYELFAAAGKRLGFPLWMPGSAPMIVMRKLVRLLDWVAKKTGREPVLNDDLVKLQEFDALLNADALKSLGWKPVHPDSLRGLLQTVDYMEKAGEL